MTAAPCLPGSTKPCAFPAKLGVELIPSSGIRGV